ncbi:MAG: nucleotidyltransferase family protein [Gemmatimonadaceae bacterium]|nr:nucleotidyltransferase family protein [Gemmatimonadaceae bacterium]
MDALTPAHEFVLASLRRDPRAAMALAAATARVSDWRAVELLAARHDVGWWVVRALPASAVPAVRRALEDRVRRIAAESLAGTQALLEIIAALDNAGVAAVAYKGPALSSDVHGDLGARYVTDLDVLVGARHRERAEQALTALGYEPSVAYTTREARVYTRWEGVSHFRHPQGVVPVELHWRVQAPRYGAPQDPATIVGRARVCTLAGRSIPVPAIEDLAVLLAVHGVKHAWSSLLWVADFAAAVGRAGFDWDQLGRVAAEWNVRRAVYDALLVARTLLALDVPAEWLARAQRDANAVALAADAVRALLSDAEHPNDGLESTPAYDLRWLDGSRAKLRYLVLAAALPTPQERRAVRLPDALLPLAVPVRLGRLVGRAFGAKR